MTELFFWSASRLASALRARELSAVEVLEAHLARIAAVNPKINAVVQLVADRAMTEARELDRLSAKGQSKGPLHGVPITIKDSLDTAGIVSTGGTRGREHHVPERDAPVVARLRAAGAILMGKSNTPELTLSGETDNLIYGRTSNPYDLSRTPGGSSGGSAAIIAAGGAALELGSDTGGSIREPAHFCGIAGIKPNSGRMPRTGHVVPYAMGAVDSLTVIAPMARYVEDLALSLPIICGPDWEDPSVVPMPLGEPSRIAVTGLRVAMHTDNGVVALAPELAATVRAAATALKEDGVEVIEARPGALPRAALALRRLREADGGAIVRRLLKRAGTDEPGPFMSYCFRGPPPVSGEEYSAILEAADEARSEMLGFMKDYDAILCPPARQVAPTHGSTLDEGFDLWSYCTVYNLTGWPAVVVRAGENANGLPIGVQIVARPWREDVSLALAARIETLLGGYRPPTL